MRFNTLATIITALLVTSMALPVSAGEKTLPDPDGKPGDVTKPVKVHVMDEDRPRVFVHQGE